MVYSFVYLLLRGGSNPGFYPIRVIFDYFELVTRVPMEEIEKMKQAVKSGENPMIFKKKLAKEIVVALGLSTT